MTREIKFRAWNIEQSCMYSREELCGYKGVGVLLWMGKQDGLHNNLMQYTGLKDKDGKDIYEEDILQVTYSGGLSQRRIVLYHEDRFATQDWQDWQDKTQKRETSLAINSITYEVIGNIYETPDLFTKKTQYE